MTPEPNAHVDEPFRQIINGLLIKPAEPQEEQSDEE